MFGLEGRCLVVTGGGGGIGSAVVLKLANLGARVVAADIDAERLEQALGAPDRQRIVTVVADLAEEEGARAVVAASHEAFGKIHGIANLAAAIPLMADDADVHEADPDLWDRTFRANVRGAMLACKHVLPDLIAAGGGSIVNFASLGGLTGMLTHPAYYASKAAVVSMTRSIATRYGKQNVRANVVAPGLILHRHSEALVSREFVDADDESRLLERQGLPDDPADAVAFLLSDASRFITAQVLSVDGGAGAHIPTFASLRRIYGFDQHDPAASAGAPAKASA